MCSDTTDAAYIVVFRKAHMRAREQCVLLPLHPYCRNSLRNRMEYSGERIRKLPDFFPSLWRHILAVLMLCGLPLLFHSTLWAHPQVVWFCLLISNVSLFYNLPSDQFGESREERHWVPTDLIFWVYLFVISVTLARGSRYSEFLHCFLVTYPHQEWVDPHFSTKLSKNTYIASCSFTWICKKTISITTKERRKSL